MVNQDFKEEEISLEKMTSDIDKEITYFTNINKSLEDDLDRSAVFDYDDASRYSQAKTRYDNNNESIGELREIRQSPYFGRLVLEDEKSHKENSLYIGKKGLFLDGTQRVVDWRTEIGGLFYKKDLTSTFNVKGFDYKLILKREFEIKNAVLKICKTLYDLYDLGDLGEVVDTFLIDVLKDNLTIYNRGAN